MGFEPTTSTLARLRSTPELRPRRTHSMPSRRVLQPADSAPTGTRRSGDRHSGARSWNRAVAAAGCGHVGLFHSKIPAASDPNPEPEAGLRCGSAAADRHVDAFWHALLPVGRLRLPARDCCSLPPGCPSSAHPARIDGRGTQGNAPGLAGGRGNTRLPGAGRRPCAATASLRRICGIGLPWPRKNRIRARRRSGQALFRLESRRVSGIVRGRRRVGAISSRKTP